MTEIVVHGQQGAYRFTLSTPVTEKQVMIVREATRQVDALLKELRDEG